MDVRSVMTPDPVCCGRNETLQTAAHLMIERDCGGIPVVNDTESKQPIGIITDRDIAVRAVARGVHGGEAKVADYMTSPCITVRPDDDLDDCCAVMEQHQLRRVLVVDDAGRLCGIVALADVAQKAARAATAEVVKEISQP
jgi:CBS domain-containing protein